jgi:tetratricopeptide (TPR) repeat protein
MGITNSTAIFVALLLMQTRPATISKGKEAFATRKWEEAEKWFSQAAASNPKNAEAQKWLGMTSTAQGDFLKAEPRFRSACELDRKDADSCYYLGRTLYSLSRFEAALKAFEWAHANPARRGRTLLGTALTLDALNRDSDAERFYRDAIAAGEKQAELDYSKFRRKILARPNAAVEIRFEAKDLPFTVRNGALGKRHLPETMIAGVAVLDFDNDGWPDLYIANGASLGTLAKTDRTFHNALLHNNRDGTFTDMAAKAGLIGTGYSMGVAAADFDNDGLTDLFVAGVKSNHLYRNRGDGTFQEVTASAGVAGDGSWSVAAAWFDYDNDGLLDLFVVRYVKWDADTEPYCGTDKFRQYCHPRNYEPLANVLYKNMGNGKFLDVSKSAGISRHLGKGMGVAIGDYDNDGRLDIFVANDSLSNFLFHNLGNGKFEEVALAAGVALDENGAAISSMGAEFRDVDNDGREDLWITALSNETFPLFRNRGNGTFEDVSLASGVARASLPWSGWSNAIADFNNDGWKDLFSANGHVMDNAELSSGRQSKQPNLLLTNGRKAFAARTLAGDGFHRGLAAADFDRDGRVDLAVTRLNEPARILWNRTEGGGNWIALELQGTISNRDAIGAWVEVSTIAGSQWNRVPASSGYGCTPSRVLHFGLGAAEKVEKVRIRWPSGREQDLTNLPVNRFLRVIEAR